MKSKRLYRASFESQNLVDKKFVMKSLKESSNKQDNGRLEGKIFTFLLGPLVIKFFYFLKIMEDRQHFQKSFFGVIMYLTYCFILL